MSLEKRSEMAEVEELLLGLSEEEQLQIACRIFDRLAPPVRDEISSELAEELSRRLAKARTSSDHRIPWREARQEFLDLASQQGE